MSENCTFCREKVRSSKVAETDHFYIKYDLYPVTPGHALVISKDHVESIFDLSSEEWSDCKKALEEARSYIQEDDLEEVYREAVDTPLDEKSEEYCRAALESNFLEKQADSYNIGENDGKPAGRTVEHLHIHLIPRYEGDMDDPRGGVRHVIPGKGNYKK